MPSPAPSTIYLSYSRKDRRWRDQIVGYLNPLIKDGTISLWDDQSIAPGENWQAETEKALEAADVALLLVSNESLFSEFINKYEIPAFQNRGIRLIPVLVEPCDWHKVPWLASLQMYPRDARPLEDLSPSQLLQSLQTLAAEIAMVAKRVLPKKTLPKQASQRRVAKKTREMGGVFGTKLSIPPEVLRRDKELNALKDHLLDSINELKPKILGISGPPGIGKTTLALVIARDYEVRTAFHDGIFFISSGPRGTLAARVRNVLSDGLPDVGRASKDVFPSILSSRKILLILDDPDLEDSNDFSEVTFLCRFSRVLVVTPSRKNLERLQARIFEIGSPRLVEVPESDSSSSASSEPKLIPASPSPTIPFELKTRRIIQPRLVSTTCVAADGEAEHLTSTAQLCMLALREFLASDETHTPLTVAVEAPWGGGKSSLMRHLQDALTNTKDKATKKRPFKEQTIPTVWFNPWKHEAGKTLWAAFAVAFERQMAEQQGFLSRQLKRIYLAIARLELIEVFQLALRLVFWGVVLYFLGGLVVKHSDLRLDFGKDWKEQVLKYAPLPAMIGATWIFLKDVVKQLGSPLKLDVSRLLTHNDHVDKVDDLHRFHEDFRRMIRTYIPSRKNAQGGKNNSSGKAVVFIDDLDRCEAPKAAELLQSLHQMLNVQERSHSDKKKDPPGIICVLGMDRKKVAAAVAAKHEKLLPLLMKTDENGKVGQKDAMIFGHEFLEKFIQLTLHVPAMQGRDLEEYLTSIIGTKEIKPESQSSAVIGDDIEAIDSSVTDTASLAAQSRDQES